MSTTFDDTRTDVIPVAKHAARPSIPRIIRKFAIPIILGWIALIGVLNVAVCTGWVGSAMSRTKTPGDLVGAARVFVGNSRVES